MYCKLESCFSSTELITTFTLFTKDIVASLLIDVFMLLLNWSYDARCSQQFHTILFIGVIVAVQHIILLMITKYGNWNEPYNYTACTRNTCL